MMRKLLVKSDEYISVHVLTVSPASSFKIAQAIIGEKTDFERTRRAGMIACEIIRSASEANLLAVPARKLTYLSRFEDEFGEYDSEARVLAEALPEYQYLFLASEYGL